jgi:hypothetical protein
MSDPTPGEQVIFANTVRDQCVRRGFRIVGYTEEEIFAECIELSKRVRQMMDAYARESGVPLDHQAHRLTPPEIAQMLHDGHPATEGLLTPR